MEIDQEATRLLQEQPKYQMYLSWLRENGCEFPLVNWPVVFAPFGVVGASAIEDLHNYDAISWISLDCIMSTDKANASDLGEIFARNPRIFEHHYDRDYFKLALFMMYEYGKGESGFYFPYLNTIDNPYSIIHWTLEELEELQDMIMETDARGENEKQNKTWNFLKNIIKDHPHLFPNPSKKEFLFWYMAVTSRSFGYSLPCSMMVPFADNMNHANIQSDVGLYEKGMYDRDSNKVRERQRIEDLPTDCKVWNSGYETASQEDDTENEDEEKEQALSEDSSEESEDEGEEQEEDWTWYNSADPSNVYFKLTTITGIQKDSQIFISYGHRSNRHLLLWYGFCIPGNRYDVVHVKFDYQTFKLRREKFCKKIVEYYRKQVLGRSYIDIMVDLSVEKQALNQTVVLLEMKLDEYPTTKDQDRSLLEQELPPRLLFAVIYRISWKEILIRNIERLKATERIMEDVMSGTEYLTAQLKEEATLLFPMRSYLKEVYYRSNFADS